MSLEHCVPEESWYPLNWLEDTVTENRRVNRGMGRGKRVRHAKMTVPEKWKNVT